MYACFARKANQAGDTQYDYCNSRKGSIRTEALTHSSRRFEFPEDEVSRKDPSSTQFKKQNGRVCRRIIHQLSRRSEKFRRNLDHDTFIDINHGECDIIPNKSTRGEVLDELHEAFLTNDRSIASSDRNLPGDMHGIGQEGLEKQNQKLRRALKITVKSLECERAQCNSLRDRVEKLSEQVNKLYDGRDDSTCGERGHSSALIDHLHLQVAEQKRLLEMEISSKREIEKEAQILKEENLKNAEKIKMLIFTHIPESSLSYHGIGPCDPSIIECENQVADYVLGKKLGEGHYGKVCIGSKLSDKKKFAIKVLKKAMIQRLKDLQQIALEVDVLKKYPHPNMITLKEIIHSPKNIYLVTELCAMDLHRYHNDFGLSEFSAQNVIFGILKPLYHLHAHGICHLDLKPENILISANANLDHIRHDDIRLCDFGLVTMAKDSSQSKEIIRKGYACGTPGFFAPEMVLNNAFEGRQADIWSLGCIILEITLGFTKEWIESYDLIDKSTTGFRTGLKQCLDEIAPVRYPRHSNLLNIIHGCLTLHPEKRISSEDALLHPWFEDVIMDTSEGTSSPLLSTHA